jgi:Zn-dependent protease with chaperone function
MNEAAPARVIRYETEIPLLILVILTSIALWIFIALSIVGAFYAVFFLAFFFLAHLALVAHLRGSAVKLGPEQLPDLFERVRLVAERLGMKRLPDAYLMQAGGVLNAFATKFFRSNFIVLYSELLEACGDDTQAADFVIAHELGHVQAGHLRFQWLIAPGRLFPFIGSAYSRARECTADRYGYAGITDPDAATRGLTVLAAGKRHAPRVNVDAFLQQQRDMATVWMTIGRWMSTHPPLVDRIAALDRSRGGRVLSSRAVLGAAAVIAFAFLIPIAGGGWLMRKFMKTMQQQVEQAQVAQRAGGPPARPRVIVNDVPAAAARAQHDLRELADTADEYRRQTGRFPEDTESLYAIWRLNHARAAELIDPFDGTRYGYETENGDYDIFSAGENRKDVKVRLHITSNEQLAPKATTATRP